MKSENNQYFRKYKYKSMLYLTILGLIFLGVTLVNIYVGVIFTICFSCLLVYILKVKPKGMNDRLISGMKEESPESLIELFDVTFGASKMQDAIYMKAYMKALVYSYFGEFHEAEVIMNELNWEKCIPYYKATNISIVVLKHYLNQGDYEEGVRLSKEMQELTHLAADVKGSKEANEFSEAYIEIGELLLDCSNEGIIESLESKYESTQLLPKLLYAWCLARTYKGLGLEDKAKDKVTYLEEMAPYCVPFQLGEN